MPANDNLLNEDASAGKQNIRIFDILILSPILIYIGVSGKMNRPIQIILVLIGLGTIIYNGYYFVKYRK